jgi:hypothetical protein
VCLLAKINLDELLDNIDNQDIILILDHDISAEEIVLAVNKHTNGKASGDDEIINEYLKRTVNQFLPIYVKLLNLIFSSGIKPYSWVVGIIKPDKYKEISEYMTNRQSCTEYPFLSSPYTPEISPMSYDNLLNLEFRIEVNNFLMLEVRQIA